MRGWYFGYGGSSGPFINICMFVCVCMCACMFMEKGKREGWCLSSGGEYIIGCV